MTFKMTVTKDDGRIDVLKFSAYKVARIHYGRMINERNTVLVVLNDSREPSKVRLQYKRGLV